MIKLQDGGVLKPLSAFSWDTDISDNLGPSNTSPYPRADEEGHQSQAVTTTHTNERRSLFSFPSESLLITD